MFENLGHFFKRMVKQETKELGSKDAAKERLHLVLMQDRANVSADFLELMKQEIIDVIKKYIVVDEESIDVRLTNQSNDDGTNGAPSLYANIPIVNIKNDMMAEKIKEFEGVDFNKEMGITVPSDQNQENEEPKVIELEGIKEQETEKIETEIKEEVVEDKKEEQEEKNENVENVENQKDIEKEVTEEVKKEDEEIVKSEVEIEEEQKSDINYADEEDDDDVTFDDLLKAAEEEDKAMKNKNKNKNKK